MNRHVKCEFVRPLDTFRHQSRQEIGIVLKFN